MADNLAVNNQYIPIKTVRRDFDPKFIYFDERKNRAVINDPDLNFIFNFYRKELKPGSLLNLGAGSTHWHYTAAIEDRVSHITAFDLSEKNIDTLKEFTQAIKMNDDISKKYKNIEEHDITMLKLVAEACGSEQKPPISSKKVLESVYNKSLIDNKLDLVIGDMHNLSVLNDRKFNNIIIAFSLFVNTEDEMPIFFRQVKNYLNQNGKVIVLDFDKFTENDIDEIFSEDENILKKYPKPIDYSLEMLVDSMIEAGFDHDYIHSGVKDVETDAFEKWRGYKYFYTTAENRQLI